VQTSHGIVAADCLCPVRSGGHRDFLKKKRAVRMEQDIGKHQDQTGQSTEDREKKNEMQGG